MVITVTGSTGTIGGELLRLLAEAARREEGRGEAGFAVRAVLRDPARLRPLEGVAWIRADLRDARLREAALAGTGRLFLLSGNEAGFARMQSEVVRAARALGVPLTVKLSALGASSHSNSPIAREHWEVEQVLQEPGTGWTILRPHAFMQNWLGEVAEGVRERGVIESPVGDGRVPFIDARDIAAVAAEALLHPEAHAGRRWFLTGGEAVGYADLAAAVSEATGRPVAYRPLSMEEARSRLEARGLSPFLIDSTLAIAAYQRAGGPTSLVSDKVERILGRPPRTIRDFVRDHLAAFTPGGR